MKPGITRRTFLGGMLAAALAAVFGLRWWQLRRQDDILVELLLKLFDRHEFDSAALLGQRYREAVPQEAGQAALAAALVASLGAEAGLPAGDLAGLRRLVDERIRGDFAAGRVVDVDGWLLAVTEARICALASLAADAKT